MTNNQKGSSDMNRDPISGAPGAHPIGTGVGATGGAIAGAGIGAVGGPVGMAVGGAIGAVVGGLGGKAAGEAVNPTAEEAYWRENYSREPYYEQGRTFDDYAPAYRLGLTGRTRYQGDWTGPQEMLPFRPDPFRMLTMGKRPIEDTMAALVCHGALTRNPDLRILSIENGADWVPYLFKQFENTYKKMPPARNSQ